MNDTHTTTNGAKRAPRPHKKLKQLERRRRRAGNVYDATLPEEK